MVLDQTACLLSAWVGPGPALSSVPWVMPSTPDGEDQFFFTAAFPDVTDLYRGITFELGSTRGCVFFCTVVAIGGVYW